MHKSFLFAVLSACAFGASAQVTHIVPGYFYPASVQAGEKTRVVTGGMGYGGISGVWVSGGGVKVTKITQVPGFPRAPGKTEIPWVREWFYEILSGTVEHREMPPESLTEDTDWQKNPWLCNLDEHTDDLEMQIIGRYLYTPEDYPQATPALDHLIILDVEVDPKAKPGCRMIYLYDGRDISAPHPFYVTAEPHLREPEFVIPPLKDRHAGLNTVLHYPTNLVAKSLPVAIDGQCWPSENDVFKVPLRKGRRVTFVMTARELLPYLGDAVPGWFNPVMRLTDANGQEIGYADDFSYLPDPVMSVVVPESGTYTLEIHDNLYRGRSDFVYTVRIYEDDMNGPGFTPQQRAFECYPPPVNHLPPKAGSGADLRTGKIDFPGRVVRHDFKIKEPKSLSFAVFARRCGSPLDPELRLYGPLDGKTPLSASPLLATWNDCGKFLCGSIAQALTDARGSWKFLEPGDYCVTVSDEPGDGGEDYTYTLAIEPLEPTFEVYATRSCFLMNGGVANFGVKVVRRNGFNGTIEIDGNEDFTSGDNIRPDVDEMDVSVRGGTDWKGMKYAQLFASAEIAPGVRKTVRIVPGDPVEQAFAYTHYLPASAFGFFIPEN